MADEVRRVRRINPQNPMRANRWRKLKQQVPRGDTVLKDLSPLEAIPGVEVPHIPV